MNFSLLNFYFLWKNLFADASNQLVDWLQRLRSDLLRPLSPISTLDTEPSNVDAAAVIQTQPQTTNSTHLAGLTEASFSEVVYFKNIKTFGEYLFERKLPLC